MGWKTAKEKDMENDGGNGLEWKRVNTMMGKSRFIEIN